MKNEVIEQVLEKLVDMVTDLSKEVSTLKADAINVNNKVDDDDIDFPNLEDITDDQWEHMIGKL